MRLVAPLQAPETETGGGMSVRDAFRAAVAAANPGRPAGQSDIPQSAPEPEDPAEPEDPSEPEEPAEPEAPAEPARSATRRTAPPAEPDLITDEEFAALQTKHEGDAVALRKSLLGAFTKKTQALAEQKRSVERLQQYQPLIDGLETDPAGTLRYLVDQYGVDLSQQGDPSTGGHPDAADQIITELTEDIRSGLGSDLEYLAEPLSQVFGNAVVKAVQRLTQGTVERTVRPMLQRDAELQTQTVMQQFAAKHPGWEKYEAQMMADAQGLDPKGKSELDYLELLYRNAAFDDLVEREVNGRFKKRVAQMNAGASDMPTRATPEGQVRKRPAGPVDFRQAAKDALAGIRYED